LNNGWKILLIVMIAVVVLLGGWTLWTRVTQTESILLVVEASLSTNSHYQSSVAQNGSIYFEMPPNSTRTLRISTINNGTKTSDFITLHIEQISPNLNLHREDNTTITPPYTTTIGVLDPKDGMTLGWTLTSSDQLGNHTIVMNITSQSTQLHIDVIVSVA